MSATYYSIISIYIIFISFEFKSISTKNSCEFSSLCSCEYYNKIHFIINCSYEHIHPYDSNSTITYVTRHNSTIIKLRKLNRYSLSKSLLGHLHRYNISSLSISDIFLKGDDLSLLPPSLLTLRLVNTSLNSAGIEFLGHLANLRKLTLTRQSDLTELLPPAFDPFVSLTYLDVSRNRIDYVHPHALLPVSGRPVLDTLDLRHNKLTTMSSVVNATSTTLLLSGNPWECYCSLRWMRDYLATAKAVAEAVAKVEPTVCAAPANLTSRPIRSIRDSEFKCQLVVVEPPEHNLTVCTTGANANGVNRCTISKIIAESGELLKVSYD